MKSDQIILRISDEFGFHIIRKGANYFSIEGYREKPENYRNPPEYYFHLTENEVRAEFEKQGKTFVPNVA